MTLYDLDGPAVSVTDAYMVLCRRFDAIDALRSTLDRLDNASKGIHRDKRRTRVKAREARSSRRMKTALHRQRLRVRRMVRDMHQKISWLADHYRCDLPPSFQTKAMVTRYEQMVATDGAKVAASEEQQAKQSLDAPPPPATAAAQADDMPTSNAQAICRWKRERRRERSVRRQRRIPSSTARAIFAQSHFKFKTLLRYKMARVVGLLIDCEKEFTSKTCSWCGEINEDLGGSPCSSARHAGSDSTETSTQRGTSSTRTRTCWRSSRDQIGEPPPRCSVGRVAPAGRYWPETLSEVSKIVTIITMCHTWRDHCVQQEQFVHEVSRYLRLFAVCTDP
jgi:hypothetical protein